MMEKKDIVVVIPIYKATLTQYEEMSLNQCVKVLANYSLVVIKPTSLDINELLSQYSLLKVENFPDDCFSNLRAYNKLVLSEDFYQRFVDYQYMLIFQLGKARVRLYWRSVVAGTTGREDGQWQMYFVKALFLQVDRKSKIETMEIFYI